jgi:hypothetical protein
MPVAKKQLSAEELLARQVALEQRNKKLGEISRKKLERPFTPSVTKFLSASAHTGRIDPQTKTVLAVATFVNIARAMSFSLDAAKARKHNEKAGFRVGAKDSSKAADLLLMPVDLSKLSGGARYTRKRKREDKPVSDAKEASDAEASDSDESSADD